MLRCRATPKNVSIHAPARGATREIESVVAPRRFQFTLPRGERQGYARETAKAFGFNSRSREGSDDGLDSIDELRLIVSIHAPARGATIEEANLTYRRAVSIHAPARGATPKQR